MIQIKYYDFLLKGNSFMMKEIKYLLNKFPNNPWITVYYWQIAGDENELKIGEQDINFIENCKYLDFEMLRRIAYYLQRVDENELAEQIQIQSLKLNPKSFVNLNNYAQLLRDSYNRYEECIQYCEKSLEQNPRYSVAWLNLSFAYQQQQNYEKSIVNIKKVLELQKNMPIFYEGLIQNYCNLEQSDMVFYYCQKADKKFPNDQSINMIYTQELVQNLIEFEFYENQNDKDLELSQIIQYKNLNMIYKDETYINDYNQMSNSFNHLFDLFDDLYDFIEMV